MTRLYTTDTNSIVKQHDGFVILIFVYVYKMNKLDRKYDVDEDRDDFVSEDTYYPDKGGQE